MRKLVYYIGSTIDGYIAGPAGEYGFYPLGDDVLAFIRTEYPETLPTHVRAQLGIDAPNKRFDTVVMGRGTYQIGLDVGITSPYQHLRQYVVSGSLRGSECAGVTLVAADPVGLVRRLKQESGLDIWLCGGGQLAGQLLPEIDEVVLKQYPCVAGAGIPLFTGEFRPRGFDLADTTRFENGTLVLRYTPLP
jgi:dihydrofolate reductase